MKKMSTVRSAFFGNNMNINAHGRIKIAITKSLDMNLSAGVFSMCGQDKFGKNFA